MRHGKVIAEGWWKPNSADKPHILNSASKSFNSTAVGLAIEKDKLKLDDKALAHWDAADEADSSDGGHGDAPLDILAKYADTKEKQDACLQAIRDRQAVNGIWSDQIGAWAYEASGLKSPTLDGRFKWPQPCLS